MISLQNHDQVGNRAGSQRLSALVPPEAVKAAVAILCATPAIPLLFMGEEYGETAPFPFFASFLDPGLQEAVSRGRQDELERLGWPGPVHDPSDPATFASARLNRTLVTKPGHRELREYYRAWLTIRSNHPALGARNKQATQAEMADGVLLVTRQAPKGERVVLAANLTGERRPLPRLLAGSTVLLDSAEPRFGGTGGGEPLAPIRRFCSSSGGHSRLGVMPERWDPIDHLLALDPGGRGIAAIFCPGAARRAAQALRGARRVLIATGFTVAENAPETDGPPGAAVLGRALGQLGARVRYVTDPQNVPLLEAALAVVGERADIVVYPEGDGAAPALLRRERPTHMVAIERPGRGPGGDYLNARGVSVKAWNRPIDELFLCGDAWEPGSKRGWPASQVRVAPRPPTWRRC